MDTRIGRGTSGGAERAAPHARASAGTAGAQPRSTDAPAAGAPDVRRPLVEVCVDDPAGAMAAEDGGADRVELCSALIVGGLTPSIGTVRLTVESVGRVGVQVLIRPRAGDFVFDAAELRTMTADIVAVREVAGSTSVPVGFVIGALTGSAEVDRSVTAALVAACAGAPVTFHRAFDLTPDVDRSLDTLMELGIDTVLTAGGAPRATDGLPALAGLVRRAAGRIRVMAGGSVRAHNVRRIIDATGVPEVHFRAVERVANHLSPRHPEIRMSAGEAPDEARDRTSAEAVARVLRALDADG